MSPQRMAPDIREHLGVELERLEVNDGSRAAPGLFCISHRIVICPWERGCDRGRFAGT